MTTLWAWLLLACALALGTKLLGYAVPARWLAGPRMARMAGVVTAGLLAALVVSNTLGDARGMVLDARLGALLAAALALYLRLPFLLVVLIGAVTAALLRLWL